MGYGPNEANIKKYIKKNKLSNCIKIIKFKNNPYKYIWKSNLFILTSLYEGLPNVILEAMALKKFVISSNCPTGPREILINGNLGYLFQMKNYIQLSNLILKFINDKSKSKKVIELAYRSLARFDYEANCKKYFYLIKKFI